MADWKEEYKRKFVSAEEAVRRVKSGDRVMISSMWEPRALALALSHRKDELTGMDIFPGSFDPQYAWFQPGNEESFNVYLEIPPGVYSKMGGDHPSFDHISSLYPFRFKSEDERGEGRGVDVFMVVVSPPDENGLCSFGHVLLSKKDTAKRAKVLLAEVTDAPRIAVRAPGDNFIHVDDIDAFIEHTPSDAAQFRSPQMDEPSEHVRWIAEYVSTLVRDGDTIELGMGRTTESLALLGAFDNKHDLGLHSGMTFPGCIDLIKAGVFNGKRKNINREKVITSWLFECDEENLAFVNNNPMFEMQGLEYMHNIRIISSNDNFVAMNGVLSIDLRGQMTSESMGSRVVGIAGGLPPFAMSAMLSKGGRNINIISSTAVKGTISRIVPTFETGTIVTIPHTFADLVVSEYGIARLLGKSRRQRAEELIAIAHPDFRAELKREAQRLYS